MENSSQRWWKSPIHTGLHKIQLLFLLHPSLKTQKKINRWEWASGNPLCFLLPHLQNHTLYLQAIKLSRSSDCVPHHPKNCFQLPQLSLCFNPSYQFPLTGGSNLMGVVDFYPSLAPCRNTPNISNIFGSWPINTLLCLCASHRATQHRWELPIQGQEAQLAALALHSMTPLPHHCLPHRHPPATFQIKPLPAWLSAARTMC